MPVLNRSDVRNASNGAMVAELTQAFCALAEDENIRAIILSAISPAFCAGGDRAWMSARPHSTTRRIWRMHAGWRRCCA
jgi:enoyl-CoA hydratase/carnithine racemase